MSAHTPGPWVIENSGWSGGSGHTGGSIGAVDKSCGTFRVDSDGKPVLQYHSRTIINYTIAGNGIEESVNLANAKLIASAPDLLAALEQCRMTLYTAIKGTDPAEHVVIKQADAAIARAKGEAT